MTHFYGADAAEMAFPEFMDALSSMNEVTNEMRPRTPSEIVTELGKTVEETLEANRRRAEAKAETASTSWMT